MTQAWNIKPSNKKSRPTAEFVESSLVFIYGITNVFLEHLNAWGSEWTAQDLEHLAITFLFIGGGLVGCHCDMKTLQLISVVWYSH